MSGTKRVSNIDHGGQTTTTGLKAPAAPTDATPKGYVDDGDTSAKARANHTGSQPASTISDFDTAVRRNRLDQMAAPTSPVSLNNQRIVNMEMASGDADAAQWGQVKALISGRRKNDVRVLAPGNITLSGTQTIEGVALVAGDRVLAVGQTKKADNGIYVVATGAWSRSIDADEPSEFTTQWLVTVREGNINADTLWEFAGDEVVTLGTTNLPFVKIGPLTASDRNGYASASPAVAAGGAWTVAHGLGSTFVVAQVRRTSSPMDFVDVYIRVVDAQSISVEPDIAFTAGEYTVMVQKVA